MFSGSSARLKRLCATGLLVAATLTIANPLGDAALYRVSHNSKHLADEFMADPFGRASPELQRVLMIFRGEPLEGKPILVCTKPFEEWALALHPGRRGVPLTMTEHRFTSLAEAERFVFRLRWKKYTGHDLG